MLARKRCSTTFAWTIRFLRHLLRLIEKHISFAFVREKLKDSYSETGRPSIAPELLLRILLIVYLYGITSERKLVEELCMHLTWCWFTGLGFDQEIPQPSTFAQNRHGRFQESKLFEHLFETIVAGAWKPAQSKGTTCRGMAASWRPMPIKRADPARAVSGNRRRRTKPCASTWWNWSSRTLSRSHCISRTKYRPAIPMRPVRPRMELRPGWVTTTITRSTIAA